MKNFEPKFNKPHDSGSEKPEGEELHKSGNGEVSNEIQDPSGKENIEGKLKYSIELEIKTEKKIEQQEDESQREAFLREINQETQYKTEGIELEVEESSFEYSEEIRKTSGVKGYIRKQISWDEIKDKYPG
ncbi:MAG: hypothetical protein ABEI53_03375, partial [Candidatus Magasanikbacteria bacterium]